MESNLLKVFVAVADKKSLTNGAKKLKVTQANVTLRIKQLEKNLGYKLFHRVPKGIILTKEGETLLPLATQIIKKLKEAQNVMKNINVQNTLIIASTFSNASMRLIPFLQKINKDFPSLQLELITNNSIPITQLLLEYKVDIGFINHEPNNSELLVLNKFDNELLLIEPKKQIENNIIISHEATCAFYTGLKEYYKHVGVQDYETIEIADFEVILACVELGMGKSLLPKSIINKFGYLSKLKTTVIDASIVDIPTCMVCRKDNEPKISKYLKEIVL